MPKRLPGNFDCNVKMSSHTLSETSSTQGNILVCCYCVCSFFVVLSFVLPPKLVKATYQRAANGGSDPSWLNLAFLGRPDFQSRGPQIPIFKGFGDLWTENRGAPKTPNSTTTDLTPHLRPSELMCIFEGGGSPS